MNPNISSIIFPSSIEEAKKKIWAILGGVSDPEIPVLSVTDLGIVREIKTTPGEVEVIITPTYSGCPAMDVIGMEIRKALRENGFMAIKITHQLSPAWTTDWMTSEGKEKLKSYGIAPPVPKTKGINYQVNPTVMCPLCHSSHTKLISQFGSTACKALYQCMDCMEPFDYFKCH